MIKVNRFLPTEKIRLWNNQYNLGIEEKRVVKGETLLQAGFKCRHLYIVEKGFLRMFYHGLDSHEYTHWFAGDGSVCTSPFSFFRGEPNILNIEVLEDSEIIILNQKQTEKIVSLIDQDTKPIRNLFIEMSMIMSRRIINMNTESAEKQYMRFKQEFPEVFKRAKKAHIASYIGVRPQSLSRIINNIENK